MVLPLLTTVKVTKSKLITQTVKKPRHDMNQMPAIYSKLIPGKWLVSSYFGEVSTKRVYILPSGLSFMWSS